MTTTTKATPRNMPARATSPVRAPETDRVFSAWDKQSYPYHFRAEFRISQLVGGIPTDPKVAEGWLRSKLQESDERIRQMVAEVMVERGVSMDEATGIVNEQKNLNGFKHLPSGQLIIEGRQVKAALKEAVSVAVAAKKIDMTGWGATRKWLTNFLPEHVFILEDKIPLYHAGETKDDDWVEVMAPDGINQQFVHTRHGSSIQYQEYVTQAHLGFEVISDYKFSRKDWAMLWTTGERNGLGASRSQGYGTYSVIKWDLISGNDGDDDAE